MNEIRVAGEATAPLAAAVIADTGALAAGTYRLRVHVCVADVLAAGKGVRIEYRNAANNASNLAQFVPAGTGREFTLDRLVVAAGERVRVVVGAVAGAASSIYGALIELMPIS